MLSRNLDGPGPFDAGWKDTIAVRIGDHPGTYVFHCHNLEHEDMAMMANVRVV